MEEAGDLIEDSWFFGNLLNTKSRTISRSYSDLASSSSPLLSHPPLCSTQEHLVKKDRENSVFSSRKQPSVARPTLTRTPSLPNSIETQSFSMKKPEPGPNSKPILARIDKREDDIKNEPKSSNLSSRNHPPIAPSLSNSTERQSFQQKKPGSNLTRTTSMSICIMGSDQEDEEDQESEFTLGRLIRQASMNSSHTSNLPRQTKAMIENMPKKLEVVQEKIIDGRKTERSRSQNRKNKNGGGAPAIPGVWVDKSLSEDMKAHIKFWARSVASNLRQECS